MDYALSHWFLLNAMRFARNLELNLNEPRSTSSFESPMRELINQQLQLGEQDIGAIEIDHKSRDDIPRLLRGLQYIYLTPEVREPAFAILAEVVAMRADGEGPVSTETGRPDMTQWQMLVLGTLRPGLNADYDRIEELANQHRTVRQMLGYSDWSEEKRWNVQTLEDNLRLFTLELGYRNVLSFDAKPIPGLGLLHRTHWGSLIGVGVAIGIGIGIESAHRSKQPARYQSLIPTLTPIPTPTKHP
jgi:hypothetical protein